MAEAENNFYSSHIPFCIFNGFFSYTAIMLNMITIHALRKMSSFPKTLKTLLLSLAVSDLGVGLLVQPLYITFVVMRMEQNTKKNQMHIVYLAYVITVNLFSFDSFFGVTALCADRFLAIKLHLRHQELVTHKRITAVIVLIWVLSVLLSLSSFYGPMKIRYVMFVTIWVACLITSAVLYCKIYSAVRRHKNQIQSSQVQQIAQNGEIMANSTRQRKSAVGTFYAYLVFLACYLPDICISVAFITFVQSPLMWHLQHYTVTLVFLNSSLNPLIYCWKMRHIRRAIVNILRNIIRHNWGNLSACSPVSSHLQH